MRALILLLLVTAALADPGWMERLPERSRPDVDEPVVDAIQIWRRGAEYVHVPAPEDTELPEAEQVGRQRGPFKGLTRETCWFLEDPYLRSAVQFSCASQLGTYEQAVEAVLVSSETDEELRLLALTILVKVHAPRSIRAQWDALHRLKGLTGHPGVGWLWEQLESEFASDRISEWIAREPPTGRYASDALLEWGVRAAGVTRLQSAIPRLVELSVGENQDASLAAVVSLAEIPGERADSGLVACLKGWRYDAYVRAASALMRRNRKLLEETLLEVTAPKDCRYYQGVFLGRLGNAAAVPILCETLPRHQIIDREMFDLVERLARAEHLELVKGLPDRVRNNQKERALKVREQVRIRLAGEPNRPPAR